MCLTNSQAYTYRKVINCRGRGVTTPVTQKSPLPSDLRLEEGFYLAGEVVKAMESGTSQ